MIDCVKMAITLTDERKQSIYMLCQNILSNYQATIRDLAQTIGVIVPSFRAVSYGNCITGNRKKMQSTVPG